MAICSYHAISLQYYQTLRQKTRKSEGTLLLLNEKKEKKNRILNSSSLRFWSPNPSSGKSEIQLHLPIFCLLLKVRAAHLSLSLWDFEWITTSLSLLPSMMRKNMVCSESANLLPSKDSESSSYNALIRIFVESLCLWGV